MKAAKLVYCFITLFLVFLHVNAIASDRNLIVKMTWTSGGEKTDFDMFIKSPDGNICNYGGEGGKKDQSEWGCVFIHDSWGEANGRVFEAFKVDLDKMDEYATKNNLLNNGDASNYKVYISRYRGPNVKVKFTYGDSSNCSENDAADCPYPQGETWAWNVSNTGIANAIYAVNYSPSYSNSITPWISALSKAKIGDIVFLAPSVDCAGTDCWSRSSWGLVNYGYFSHAAIIHSFGPNNSVVLLHATSERTTNGRYIDVNSWSEAQINKDHKRMYIARVKGISASNANAVIASARTKYSYLAYGFVNDKTTYCSDFVARAFEDYGYNLRDKDIYSSYTITGHLFLPDELVNSKQLEEVAVVNWW